MKLWNKEVVPTDLLIKEVISAKLKEISEEKDALAHEVRSLKAIPKDSIRKYSKILADVWTRPAAAPAEQVFVDDPVSGQLHVEPELCALLAHPLVQRLNHIKQLAFAYLVFPSATHSRLSHCLGVAKLVQLALNAIFQRGILYTPEGEEPITLTAEQKREIVLKAKAAAILHDVGHGPFGHALDRFVGSYYEPQKRMKHPDKEYSRQYIRTFLADKLPPGTQADELAPIVGGTKTVDLSGWDSLIADLVNSTLDLDRMDYLTRDAHMTGLSVGRVSVRELIDGMRPFRLGEHILLTYDSSALPHFGPFLYTREMMFLHCYDHPRKAAAERIFTRLVEGLMKRHEIPVEEVMMLADEQILALITLDCASDDEASNLLSALLQNQEYVLVLEMEAKDAPDWARARNKKLGKQAFIEMPGSWEQTIAEQSGLEAGRGWQILAVVPAQEVFIPVEIETPILFQCPEGYTTMTLSQVFPRLQIPLEKLIEARNKLRVFADARLEESVRTRIADVAKQVLA